MSPTPKKGKKSTSSVKESPDKVDPQLLKEALENNQEPTNQNSSVIVLAPKESEGVDDSTADEIKMDQVLDQKRTNHVINLKQSPVLSNQLDQLIKQKSQIKKAISSSPIEKGE